MIFILRGLSGAGKSTWVKKHHPKAVVCSADHFFMKNGKYRFAASKLGKAHSFCLRKFLRELNRKTKTIVVDNTNISLVEVAPYAALAQMFGVRFKIVNFKISVKKAARRNTHDVPESTIKDMKKRFDEVTLPPWWPVKTVNS